jgi:hypothetical protein
MLMVAVITEGTGVGSDSQTTIMNIWIAAILSPIVVVPLRTRQRQRQATMAAASDLHQRAAAAAATATAAEVVDVLQERRDAVRLLLLVPQRAPRRAAANRSTQPSMAHRSPPTSQRVPKTY